MMGPGIAVDERVRDEAKTAERRPRQRCEADAVLEEGRWEETEELLRLRSEAVSHSTRQGPRMCLHGLYKEWQHLPE